VFTAVPTELFKTLIRDMQVYSPGKRWAENVAFYLSCYSVSWQADRKLGVNIGLLHKFEGNIKMNLERYYL
jgi:hypothetical protein